MNVLEPLLSDLRNPVEQFLKPVSQTQHIWGTYWKHASDLWTHNHGGEGQ